MIAVRVDRPIDQQPARITGSDPLSDDFYFPAEWTPHERTIMVFPYSQNWRGYRLEDARQEWAAVANTLSGYEPVVAVVHPDDIVLAKTLFSSQIETIILPVNDGWARDTGHMILVDDNLERRVAGFRFNAWGKKTRPYRDDTLLKARLSAILNMPMYVTGLTLEGGAVTMDGEGTVITTEQCLLNPNRNPHLTKTQVEGLMIRYLGARKVIWLECGIVPDPITDGHVDGLCAFVGPGTVLLHSTNDRNDPNYQICTQAKHRLEQTVDARGRSLQIVDLPLQPQISHINLYIANGVVIVPIAGDPRQDDKQLGIIRNLFPGRKVAGIGAVALYEAGGGVHCITQQIPGGRSA